jgi:hypothetical protein
MIKKNFFLALLLIIMPILYTWHIELYYNSLIYPVQMTNGFIILDGSKMYHFLMYCLFTINFIIAYKILKIDE